MKEQAFLEKLQYEPMSLTPSDWSVDMDKSVPFKTYADEYYPLPTLLPKVEQQSKRTLCPLSYLSVILRYSYGLTSVNWQKLDSKFLNSHQGVLRFYRRPIPCAGALYENEIYLYIKGISGIKAGIYHYNIPQHHLSLVCAGNFDDQIAEAIPSWQVKNQTVTVIISTVFWRNLFKYAYFSYRLQPQDSGILLAQMSAVVQELCLDSQIFYNYNADILANILALDPNKENVFGVMDIDISDFAWHNEHSLMTNAQKQISYEVEDISAYTDYAKMIASANQPLSMTPTESIDFDECDIRYPLPSVAKSDYDIIAISRKRVSPGDRFVLSSMNASIVASILYSATQSFSQLSTDIDDIHKLFKIFISIKHNEDIEPGCYFYNSARHELCLIKDGDPFPALDQAMTRRNVNIQCAPICIHVAIDKSLLASNSKTYKTLLTQAGILYHFIQLFVTHHGLGAHILMSFNTAAVENLYQLNDKNLTILAQIPIGEFKLAARLTGSIP